MYLAQEAYNGSVIYDVCLSSGMKVGMLPIGIIMGLLVHAGLVKEFLNDALHGEEIPVAVHPQGELHALVRKFCQRKGYGTVHVGQFIQAHILVAAVVVGRK